MIDGRRKEGKTESALIPSYDNPEADTKRVEGQDIAASSLDLDRHCPRCEKMLEGERRMVAHDD